MIAPLGKRALLMGEGGDPVTWSGEMGNAGVWVRFGPTWVLTVWGVGQVSVGEREMVLGGVDFPVGEDGCGGGYVACSLEVHRLVLPREEVVSSACLSRQGTERTSAVSVQVNLHQTCVASELLRRVRFGIFFSLLVCLPCLDRHLDFYSSRLSASISTRRCRQCGGSS